MPAETAINRYLGILEGALMIRRPQPYFNNIKKRMVKRPKVYIRDTGILHRPAGFRNEADLETWVNRGSSFKGLDNHAIREGRRDGAGDQERPMALPVDTLKIGPERFVTPAFRRRFSLRRRISAWLVSSCSTDPECRPLGF